MNRRKFSRIAQLLTPPLVWNAYLKARSLRQLRSELQFGTMRTNTDAAPLLDGRFAATHDRFNSVNPHYSPNFYRYVHYNACWFAMRCRAVPGDFVIAG